MPHIGNTYIFSQEHNSLEASMPGYEHKPMSRHITHKDSKYPSRLLQSTKQFLIQVSSKCLLSLINSWWAL